jgi:hypothetical protein
MSAANVLVVRPLGRSGGRETSKNGLKAGRQTRQAEMPQLKLDITAVPRKAGGGPAGVIAGL